MYRPTVQYRYRYRRRRISRFWEIVSSYLLSPLGQAQRDGNTPCTKKVTSTFKQSMAQPANHDRDITHVGRIEIKVINGQQNAEMFKQAWKPLDHARG